MKTNWINLKLSKDFLKRKHFLKKELKIFLLKSLVHNQNIKPVLRAYVLLNLNLKNKKKNYITAQQHRCLLSGKAKTTFTITEFSRHSTKQLINLGLLQNIKNESY